MPDNTDRSFKERLQGDVNTALRAGEKDRVNVLRMALAAIQRREVDSREILNDEAAQKVIEKMVKQGQDAAEQFKKGNRDDLAAKEAAEIAVLKTYLPEPLSEAETLALLDSVIGDLAAASPSDMGRVMGEIKKRSGGRVDLGTISGLVRARLQKN